MRKIAARRLTVLAAAAVMGIMTFSASVLAANRPFPHHTIYAAGVIRPNNVSQASMDAAIIDFYRAWKTNYLRNAGGGNYWVKYNGGYSTVSEAHGYGMVLAAYMADKPVFDSMFRYFKAHPSVNSPNLMAWKQTLNNGQMVNVEGPDSATDGDMDIAYSLLLAHEQWGSAGTIKYRAEALKVLHAILAHEVNSTTWTLTPGDWATGTHAFHTRPSDFMSGHLLAFARADSANAEKWNNIYHSISAIVIRQFQHGSENTGLMPDFMVKTSTGFVAVPGTYLGDNHDGDMSYNSCRTPWRLAMSYILQGRTDMLAPLQKQASWIRSVTGGTPVNIRAGYYVRNGANGKNFVSYDDLAFTAPFAVSAMLGGPAAQTWLNRLWSSITGGDYGRKVDYYGDTIRLQVMLTVASNWWSP